MKKTLLATAITGAIVASGMAVTNVQAATVYDQDGTKVDLYGRIAMGIRGGGPETAVDTTGDGNLDSVQSNDAEFVDVYSRLGFNFSHDVSSDLSAFGRVEWRFTGDERNTASGFNEVRQSYLGLESNSWGTVQAGNFDSFHNKFVTIAFDKYIDRGLEFAGHPTQSRGDSIGYYTPDLSGFQAYIQAKHYSDRGQVEPTNGSIIATQGGAKFETGDLRLALGYVDDRVRGGGNNEMLYGATASYAFNDAFSARLGYETRDDNDTRGGGYDTVGVGMSYGIGQWAFNADIYDVSPDNADSRTSWALGSYYNLTSNFNLFAEVQQADQQSITVNIDGLDSDITADGDDVYYVTGARYFF